MQNSHQHHFFFIIYLFLLEPEHDEMTKIACVPCEYSDQAAQPCLALFGSLMAKMAELTKIACVPSEYSDQAAQLWRSLDR